MNLKISAVSSFVIAVLYSRFALGESNAATCTMSRHPSFVTAFLEEKVQTEGCHSGKLSPNSQEVHVVSLENAGSNTTSKWQDYLPSVTVTVRPRLQHSTHAGPVVLVLYCHHPVMIHLQTERIDSASRLVIVISNGSEVVTTTSQRPLIINKTVPSLSKLLSWVRNRRFGAITSFSRVKTANKIFVSIGIADKFDDDCDTNIVSPSQTVEAFYEHPVPTSGCIMRQVLLGERDIHVLELFSPGDHSKVTVHLKGLDSEKMPADKKMMIVLKSHASTTWKIQSQGINGTISVIAESEVVAENVPSCVVLQAWPKKLPVGGQQLVDWVAKKYGPVTTYTTITTANRIVIITDTSKNVPMQATQEMQNDEHFDATELPEKQIFSFSKFKEELLLPRDEVQERGKMTNWTREIAREMSSHCTKEGIQIAFAQNKVLSVLGLEPNELAITLKDPECQATTNGTHYNLHYTLIGCGARSKQRSSGSAYSNQVLFWKYKTSNKDEGSKKENVTETKLVLSLNYVCDLNVTYNGFRALEEMLQPSIFKLHIFKSKNFSNPIVRFPMVVLDRSYVFVEATITAGPNTCVSVEDCWLADNDPVHSWKSSLIRSSCPSDLSVQYLNANGAASCNQRFSFQLSGEEFSTKKTFLYCRLAACTRGTNKAIRKCIDPEEFCLNHSLRSFLDDSSYKHSGLEFQGPFTVVYRDIGNTELPIEVATAEKNLQPHVVFVVGLPVEIVVAIAFASFIIGAGLTALLWFIHKKTDPTRNKRTYPRRKNTEQSCDCDQSAYSGSSTPNSQAPMAVQA